MIVEEQGIDFWTRVQIPSGPLKVLQCLGEWCCSTFLLYRKDRRWRSVELKIARTKAGMTNKRLSV